MAAHFAGGFIHSPPPSSIASSAAQTLPHPRSSPLKPGGTKESSFIRYVDNKVLHIQRRFAKRDASFKTRDSGVTEIDEEGRKIEELDDITVLPASERWNDVRGYKSFGEASKEVEEILNVVWVSGTPSLQIPYLISLALLTSTMIAAFPASPRQMFRLLGKLDHAFASLLQARDVDTGEPLPGFLGKRGVSGTEKVRIRCLVERTRVCVVGAMNKGEFEEENEEDVSMADGSDTDADDGGLVLENPEDLDLDVDDEMGNGDWDMQVAKVYDRTLVELGESMDMTGPAIGIQTEMAG